MKTNGLKLDALNINSIKDSVDYKAEIEKYLNTPRQPKMPALNQDQLLTDILRKFSSSYPHTLLNGDTSIGKTVLSDFILETFSSEENYQKSMQVLTLEQRKLMYGMKQKFKSMQNESHI
jgi:dethiobiotin synthetase